MPGGRSEVFWERWMRNGTPLQRAGLVEEQAAPRSVALRGENIEVVAAGQGDLDGRGFGAVTEPVRMVSGCGRPPHRGGSARKGFWTPIRSPAASASPGRTGGRGRSASKPSLRPDSFRPDASRYLCGRSRFHPPGAGASNATPGKSLPAEPLPRPIGCIRKMPEHPSEKDPFRRVLGGVKPTPTTATPTPTTAISCRRRLNRPRRPYLRRQNPKNEGLWSM